MKSLSLIAVLAVVLGACATVPPPSAQMAVAEASVQQADSASTKESAPGELQIAVAKLAAARQALASHDYERATRLASEAQLDAQVAEMRAQSVRTRKAAEESQDAAHALREELNRTNTNTNRSRP
jgi:hypothetical protein